MSMSLHDSHAIRPPQHRERQENMETQTNMVTEPHQLSEEETKDRVWSTLQNCLRVYESTFPPLSLLKEAQGSEEVQAVQVVVDSELQQIILRDVEEVLENKNIKLHDCTCALACPELKKNIRRVGLIVISDGAKCWSCVGVWG